MNEPIGPVGNGTVNISQTGITGWGRAEVQDGETIQEWILDTEHDGGEAAVWAAGSVTVEGGRLNGAVQRVNGPFNALALVPPSPQQPMNWRYQVDPFTVFDLHNANGEVIGTVGALASGAGELEMWQLDERHRPPTDVMELRNPRRFETAGETIDEVNDSYQGDWLRSTVMLLPG